MTRGTFRLVMHLLDARARGWLAVGVALRIAERGLLMATAVALSRDGVEKAVAVSLLFALLAALRTASRTPLLARLRRRFTAEVTRVLLRRHLTASSGERERLDMVLFDGLWMVESVCVELAPGLVADAVAAILLSAVLAVLLPARLVVLGALTLLVAGTAAQRARVVASSQANRAWDALVPVMAGVQGCLHGGLEIVGNGRESHHEEVVAARTRTWVATAWRSDWSIGLTGKLPLFLAGVCVLLAMVYDATTRGLPLQTAVTKALLVASFLPPFVGVLACALGLVRAAPRIRHLEPLLELGAAQAVAAPRGAPVPPLPAEIAWHGLTYAYPDRPTAPVLSERSGTWVPGRLLALAGANGSGKTTLLRLLLGFVRPSAGEITVAGRDLATLDADAWHQHVAYLPQRPYMPRGATVREAILFLAPEASVDAMQEALGRVRLLDRLLTESASAPLDVLVGALSAGELQRVALARLLLQDAGVILLDEPDANLDAAGVALLGRLLRDMSPGRLIVFSAHDDHLLAAADDILRFTRTSDTSSTSSA